MKTLKTLVLGIALLATAQFVKADETVKTVKSTKNNAVDAYVSAMTTGQNTELNNVIEENAKFSILRGNKVMSFSKSAMLQFAAENKDVRQDCKTNVEEVEGNDDMSIVKVEMNYGKFVRTNYVTVANTGDGWKITNVYSVIK